MKKEQIAKKMKLPEHLRKIVESPIGKEATRNAEKLNKMGIKKDKYGNVYK